MIRGVAGGGLLVAGLLLSATEAGAQSAAPAPRPDAQFDFMNLLTAHDLHDIGEESWNAYGQFTYIRSWKSGFAAPYTNANGSINSLLPTPEAGFTGTLTLYFAARLWPGAEAYFVPEVIAEQPFSQLKGLGAAIQDFDLQKGGSATPQLYRSRAFLRQTFELGGERVVTESNPQQLGTVYDSRRLVLEVGNFSILDFFDKPILGIDPHQGFFSLAFLTYGAWDFASDARGYSWGGVIELFWDDWAVRYGRITPPQNPNQLPVDFRLYEYFGDQVELEHRHRILGLDGTVRVLGYWNHEIIGRFDDAVAAFQADPTKNAASCTSFNYGSQNATAPDLCWVRRPNWKLGIGLYAEQHLFRDIGVFVRGMYSDGRTEVDAYTSTDRSLSFGALAKGFLWSRPEDKAGVAVNFGWISAAHAEYLRMGGVDGFIGDGNINPAAESVVDVFYSVNLQFLPWRSVWPLSSTWLSGDYQHITNPGFNADRGPLDVLSVRFHAEF